MTGFLEDLERMRNALPATRCQVFLSGFPGAEFLTATTLQ